MHGELFELTNTNIKTLDMHEGSPDYYYRKKIEVIVKDKKYMAFIYFKTNTNLEGFDKDIPLKSWTKDFENAGKKYTEFLDALSIALNSIHAITTKK